MRFLILIALLFSHTCLFAEEATTPVEIYPDASAIPLNWILKKTQKTEVLESFNRLVKQEQNKHSRSLLRREEFLRFYREVLSLFLSQNRNPKPFIEATYGFLLHLNLSYEEILDTLWSAAAGDARQHPHQLFEAVNEKVPLTEAQGYLFVRLLYQQGPREAQELAKLARQSPNSDKLAAYLFPQFFKTHLRPSRTESSPNSFHAFQIALYKKAIGFFSLRSECEDFYKKTASYLYGAEPSALEIEEVANEISISTARDDELKTFPKDPIAPAEFLRFHLQKHALLLGLDRFVALSKIYKTTLGITKVKIDALLQKFHGWKRSFSDRFEALVAFRSGEEIYASFKSLRPDIISEENWHHVKIISDQMQRLEIAENTVLNFLKESLEMASDPESFIKIYILDPVGLKQTADSRFSEFLQWNPPTDLLEDFGRRQIHPRYISETVRPDQFVVLLTEAIDQTFWDEPSEFNAFLEIELPRFLSMSPRPSYPQILQVLGAIRHRPVEKARVWMESQVAEMAIREPSETIVEALERKRFFLNLVTSEFNTCVTGKLCFDIEIKAERQAMRERFRRLFHPALQSHYSSLSIDQREAYLLQDLSQHIEKTDVTSFARLLLVLNDALSPSATAIVATAIREAPAKLGLDRHKNAVIRNLNGMATPNAKETLLSVLRPFLELPSVAHSGIAGFLNFIGCHGLLTTQEASTK